MLYEFSWGDVNQCLFINSQQIRVGFHQTPTKWANGCWGWGPGILEEHGWRRSSCVMREPSPAWDLGVASILNLKHTLSSMDCFNLEEIGIPHLRQLKQVEQAFLGLPPTCSFCSSFVAHPCRLSFLVLFLNCPTAWGHSCISRLGLWVQIIVVLAHSLHKNKISLMENQVAFLFYFLVFY